MSRVSARVRIGGLLLAGIAILAIAAGASGQTAAAPTGLPLAISQADLMRAGIEVPASQIFAVQYEEKLADDEWLLLEQDATNLAGAASLVSRPGTGKKDAEWTAAADWQGWSADLQRASIAIRNAARVKDLAAMSAGADVLVETCTACHAKYRPETPTDGILRYPYYPQRKRAGAAG